ncbi:putative RNA-directed DNA polymerase, eukaryota, reverse transcriptase zinc-binding domain protein [Tanacetum coccineum]|uniref:RNA-directed DNA polymerase, eukaryota, reverse transcriptase zinc-binding domain protein n=1 Tax=Tanacetum coccineum TaxID=301880 RepID=A0ABQ5E4M3_9ASTR
MPYGRLVDAFIANKRSKRGKRFGFIRFLGIKDAHEFVKTLSNIWIGNFHLYVAVPIFQRGNSFAYQPVHRPPIKDTNPKTEPNPKNDSIPNFPYHQSHATKPSFTDVTLNKQSPSTPTLSKDTARSISLTKNDLITIEDSSTVLLMKLNEADTMSNMYSICKSEDEETSMSLGRVFISTKSIQRISDTIKVEMEANHLDKDDTSVEDKENDDLDDIDGILKDLDNDTKNEENIFVSPNDVMPDQTIKQVKEEILKQPNEEYIKVSESSDISRPPGFENTKKTFSNNSKCSTNFARHHKKDIKGISLIHELNKIIEVGTTLGYDVRGCKTSLNRMINGIGVHLAKSSLWNRLAEFMNQHNGKFILFGDFNTVRHENERTGSLFSCIEAEHFNAFIDSTGLINLPIGGRHFTWMNKAGTKLSKLDRFLIFEGVMEDIPDIKVTAIDRLWSDHSPILLHSKKTDFGPSPFKLYNSWLNRDGFDDIVKSTWESIDTDNGNNKISSHVKLRSLKNAIKKWQVDVRKNDRSQKSANLFEIQEIKKKIDDGSASISDCEKRINLLQDIEKLDNLEALDLIQKARIKWDIEGDENSKYFNGIINSKRRTRAIVGILHDGDWITEPPLIKDVFLNYYKDKFQAHDSHVIFTSIANSPTLCHHDRDFLESHILLDEVKKIVWECGSNKAPGPDGFSFAFIKKYWDLMKMDIFEFVNSFFASGSMPQDVRPISLIGTHYKIISKLLANRLSKVIDKVVSKEQSAFISGRQILDGPLIISEIIQWYKKRKKKMLIFKVDFEKAFDSLSRNYLDFILASLGFGSKWRSWIRACLHSSRASILINGSPTSEFSIKRGLRQGDPLSPFLFILIMEGLHCAMSNAVSSGLIRGIKLGSSGIVLSVRIT